MNTQITSPLLHTATSPISRISPIRLIRSCRRQQGTASANSALRSSGTTQCAALSADRRSGFTLVELLIVIAIIGILSSLAVIGFNSIGRGSGARGAADLAASMCLSARVEAMAQGYGALLVVDNSTNADRKLQRMAVLRYTNTPVEGNISSNLVLIGRPTSLPQNIYFSTNDSGFTNQTNFPAGSVFPGTQATPVYYIRFNGSGFLDSAESGWIDFIFSPGILEKDGTINVPDTMKDGRRGFRLFRNGRPKFYESANQIDAEK